MSCGLPHEERRARLIEAHGHPAAFEAGAALRLLGLRGQVHPRDVIAYAYRDREAAEAYAASNWEHYRHPRLGSVVTVEGAGVIGVTDLRPMLEDHGVAVTDPALPDEWIPGPLCEQ